MAKKTTLPKRFQPLQAQADTEAAIRYGAQESALKSIFGQTTNDYQRQAQAQDAASRSLLGSLGSAGVDLNRVYSDAGLTPSVLATIGNSPTGQRLAGELARAQAGIQQQQIGAQAGAQYQQQHLGDLYREDVGKINDQATSLATERGQFTQSLLDQLIGTDRSTRHDANVHTADQQFTADQNLLDRSASQGNALIGAGIDPNTGTTLPGHGPKPKPKPKVTPVQQSQAGTNFQKALTLAQKLTKGLPLNQQTRDQAADIILNGRPGQGGQPVYETVTDKNTGKATQQRVLNPDGTQKTTGGKGEIPAVSDQPMVDAALDMVIHGYLTTQTVKELHRLGYSANALPGIVTQFQAVKARQPLNRPGTAPDRNHQPG